MKLGITSYAYRWAVGGDPRFSNKFKLEKPLSVFDLIDRVSNLKIEVLQICENMDFDTTAEGCKKLLEAAENKSITLELGAASIESKVIKKYMRIANLIEAHLLRVYPLKKEPIKISVERIRGFLPFLRDQKLTLAIENSSLGLYSCHELATMFRMINDPLFGACVDVMNSIRILEKPLETIKVLSPYIVSLHIKDYQIERKDASGFTIFGVPLGKGMLDTKAVLNAIHESNRDPNILIEQFMGLQKDLKTTLYEEERWVKEGIKFLRPLL
jgi:sugar phosphate isomerase/epimerase